MNKEMLSVMFIWLLVIVGIYTWDVIEVRQANKQLAFGTARATFQEIVTTRAWNAMYGGVYVPVSQKVRPNPYLDDPERDLVTQQGRHLTKINPAYMTRQIAEIATKNKNGILFHITSLNPIRPGNKAYDWEKKWLLSFKEGKQEAGEFISDGLGTGFRYMAPLIVKEQCLVCHAKQGYKKGDVRGGISVTLPQFTNKLNIALPIGYASLALLGMVLIGWGGTQLNKKRMLLLQANQTLKMELKARQETIVELKEANEQVKQLRGMIPICMHCKKIRDDQGYWNRLEKYLSEHSEAQFSHSICDKCMEELYPEYLD